MTKRLAILLLVAALPVLLAAPSMAHGIMWAPAQGGTIPVGSWSVGYEQSKEALFVCRAKHQGGIHIGKIRSQFGGCNIPYGGKEIKIFSYEVLVFSLQN